MSQAEPHTAQAHTALALERNPPGAGHSPLETLCDNEARVLELHGPPGPVWEEEPP